MVVWCAALHCALPARESDDAPRPIVVVCCGACCTATLFLFPYVAGVAARASPCPSIDPSLFSPHAPSHQVLENKGHGKGVDWWSLGTLMHEMVNGLPPFYDQSVQKMYKKILTAPFAPPKNMRCRGAGTRTKAARLRVSIGAMPHVAGCLSLPFTHPPPSLH